MEFAIFVQMHLPGAKAHDPKAEHQSVLNELEMIRVADRCNWKYAWVTEHHALTEYSHLSDNPTFIAYALAQTQRIHVGSGIFNINPIVNHPVRLAERVAMLDHLSEGRFEFGTGRGAGSHEMGTFNLQISQTKEVFDEVIPEFKKMWETWDYSFQGKHFQVPPRNVVPKPWGGGKTHPPMWVAAGNPPTYEKAARLGLGVLGFNVGAVGDMKPMIDAYKGAVGEAHPVGQYVNDNVMITNGVVCLSEEKRARERACNMGVSYLQTLVFLYHDTFQIPPELPRWPQEMPEPSEADLQFRIDNGYLLCGNPEQVCEQVARYQSVGCDQLCFGIPLGMPQDEVLEMIELFGTQVIPEFDKDPVHRTTKMREEGMRKVLAEMG